MKLQFHSSDVEEGSSLNFIFDTATKSLNEKIETLKASL